MYKQICLFLLLQTYLKQYNGFKLASKIKVHSYMKNTLDVLQLSVFAVPR